MILYHGINMINRVKPIIHHMVYHRLDDNIENLMKIGLGYLIPISISYICEEYDIKENCIGAVKDIENKNNSGYNVDVLLINLMKIREREFINNILPIQLKYNLSASYFTNEKTFKFDEKIKMSPLLQKNFHSKDLKLALLENIIFSYSTSDNPFVTFDCSFYYNWLKYFRLSPFSKLEHENYKNPKITVILPIFNVSRYIFECLDCLINQTLEEIEIICVDDGSTDDSLEILKSYQKFDKRIIILTQENQSAGVARNTGLDIAKGEYISFIDPDDFLELSMLEKVYNKAKENNETDIVIFDYMIFNQFNKKINTAVLELPDYNGSFSYKDMIDTIFFKFQDQPWNKLYRLDFIKKNNLKFQNLYRCNDVYFTNLALIVAKKIVVLDNKLIYYRVGTGNGSQDKINLHPLSFYEAEIVLLNKFIEIGAYNDIKISFLNKVLIDTLDNINRIKDNEVKLSTIKYVAKNLDVDFKITENPREFYIKIFYDEFITLKNKYAYVENCNNNTENDIPKISIIIPIYNIGEYLDECLESVLSQTLKDIEIICIDDGSTDNSFSLLNKFKVNDKRIILLQQENQGAGIARNKGIKTARGEFIIFMDGDDYYPNNHTLELLYTSAINNNVLIAGGSFSKVENGIILTSKLEDGYKFFKDNLMEYKDYQFDLGYHRFIYNREMIINNNIFFPDYLRFQDPPFFVKAMI
ncbi:MAG: glycosyltransferase, partial [Peptostreptococcaceae bacterium]